MDNVKDVKQPTGLDRGLSEAFHQIGYCLMGVSDYAIDITGTHVLRSDHAIFGVTL